MQICSQLSSEPRLIVSAMKIESLTKHDFTKKVGALEIRATVNAVEWYYKLGYMEAKLVRIRLKAKHVQFCLLNFQAIEEVRESL